MKLCEELKESGARKSHRCVPRWKLSTLGDVFMAFDYFLTGSRIIYYSSNWDSVMNFTNILAKQSKERVQREQILSWLKIMHDKGKRLMADLYSQCKLNWDFNRKPELVTSPLYYPSRRFNQSVFILKHATAGFEDVYFVI